MTSERKTWILFPDGRRHFHEMQHGTPTERQRWQDALQRAYTHTLYCCCTHQPLAIKRLGTTYHIALFPKTGPRHAPFCDLHGDAFTSGNIARRYIGAIREKDSRAVIALDISLRQPPPTPGPPHNRASTPARRRQARTTLRSTLTYLWERAKLNRWHPTTAERTPAAIAHRIYHAANNVDVAQLNLARLLVTAPFGTSPDRYRAALRARVDDARAHRHALLLFGEIATNPDLSILQRIQHLAAPCNIDVTATQLVVDAAHRSYHRQLRYREGRLIVLCATTPTSPETLEIYALGLIATTESYIPIDSLHELQIARLLVLDGRTFAKPLRDPRADHLPDFVLYDTANPIEMEVFGRNDRDYIEKAQRKTRRGIWSWDATTPGRIPPFPHASTGTQSVRAYATTR